MYKFMQRYNKKLMAIFAVGLMIAFVIPQFNQSRTQNDMVMGTMGGEEITAHTANSTLALLQILRDTVLIQNVDPRSGQPVLMPLASVLPGKDEIDRHKMLFVLLYREAIRKGITVSERDLSSLLGEVQVRLPDRNVLFDQLGESDVADNVRAACRAFLLINNSFDQSLSMIKVSHPLLDNRMARALQEIKLQLVEFNDQAYADKVPAPELEQIKGQFEKYSDTLPGTVDPKTNPFGFGYKYPDRVKLAYIAISRDEVKKAIRASKDEYAWDVEAQKYYKRNGSLFATTQPTSQPTSNPVDAFTLGGPTSKPGTQPTTRPFEEVRNSIVDALIAPEATKLETTILARIQTQLREDWNTYRRAVATTGPSTATSQPGAAAPGTSVGVPYDSPEYLSKLAEQIQKQFKVVLTVASFGEKFLSQEDLRNLPGIGNANVSFGQGQYLPFNIYATALAEPFLKGSPEASAHAIHRLEPSRPLVDLKEMTYIFRLTELDPTHKPADAREVLHQVEEDIRMSAMHELARADAEKTLNAAKTSSLHSAADAAKKTVTSSSFISMMQPLPTEVSVSSKSQAEFLDQAFKLLSAAAQKKDTIAIIDLPRDKKHFIAQLADVRRIPMFAGQVIEPQVAQQIRTELGRELYEQWFKYDSVVQRVGFQDANKRKESEG